MIGSPGTNHKRNKDNTTLCGDIYGYSWEEDYRVGCRMCLLLMKRPDILLEVKEINKIVNLL